ncbi:transmembrane protein [Ceratobasidium sp. AG-Ba]|nr:transmembrane protein [Ceratobasidium sp. AG-Ba]
MRLLRAPLYALGWVSFVAAQSSGLVNVDDSNIFSESNLAGIQYGGRTQWQHLSADTNLFYQGTHSLNKDLGSQIWFSFRGTGIAYYASQDPGFGAVSISVDGADATEVFWVNSGTELLFQQRIWSVNGLKPGDHTVVIAKNNVNSPWIGLDYFSVTPVAGNNIRPTIYGPGASNVTDGAVLVDSHQNDIIYSPAGDWRSYAAAVNDSVQTMFFGHNAYCSKNPGSSATFTFEGTAVWFFSDDSKYNSRVSIRVDDGEAELVETGTLSSGWVSQKLFWSVSGLDRGKHTVTITHAGMLNDYACVDFLMYLPSSASPPPPPRRKNSVPVGAIAGGLVAGVIGLVVIITLAVVYVRRKSSQASPETAMSPAEDKSKQVDPGYSGTHLEYTPRPMSVQGGGGGSIAPTTWSGPTYKGHPEIQH